MCSSTIRSSVSVLESLASKIYLKVDGSLLREIDCYISSLKADLDLLSRLDVSSSPIYYCYSLLRLSSEDLKNKADIEVENADLLESLTSSYEFTNIRSQ